MSKNNIESKVEEFRKRFVNQYKFGGFSTDSLEDFLRQALTDIQQETPQTLKKEVEGMKVDINYKYEYCSYCLQNKYECDCSGFNMAINKVLSLLNNHIKG